MPARKDGRIEKGQSVATAISARAWNRAQQAADVVLGVEPSAEVPSRQSQPLPYSWVYAKMAVDVAVGDAVGLTGFYTDPSRPGEYTLPENELLRDVPVMSGTAVGEGQGFRYTENQSAVGIAVEPIKAQSVGRVAVSGVVTCDVWCKKAWHAYARPSETGRRQLESAPNGNIQILVWHATATVGASGGFNVQDAARDNADINQMCTALVRIGNTTPFQLIVVDVESGWAKGTRRKCPLASVSAAGTSTVTLSQIQQPASTDAYGGAVYVTNLFCDIKAGGKGICAPYGPEWILVNWTPVEVQGVNNDYYSVSSYRE